MAYENGIYTKVREHRISHEEMIKSLEIEEKEELKRKKNKWLKLKFEYEKMTDIFDYKNFYHSKLYPKGASCFPLGLDNLNKPLPKFVEPQYVMLLEYEWRHYQEMKEQQKMLKRTLIQTKKEAKDIVEDLAYQIKVYDALLKEFEERWLEG